MCGRYYVADDEEITEIREIIAQTDERYRDMPMRAAMKRGEILPTEIAPVLTVEHGRRRSALMKWGFPRWDGRGIVINARAETAAEKPMFKSSLASRRCIIPSTGFFEWAHEGGKAKKDKYLLRLPDDPMLYMAGLYNAFWDQGGQEQLCFVILTTAANESVAPIHNRMPVILPREEHELWLRDDAFAHAVLPSHAVPAEKGGAMLELLPQGWGSDFIGTLL